MAWRPTHHSRLRWVGLWRCCCPAPPRPAPHHTCSAPHRTATARAVPDNAAVAVGVIKAGSSLEIIGIGHCSDTCAFDIPEGHRFATEAVAKGETLRSWGLPFGVALRDIEKGEYLCNILSLETFRGRNSKLHLPAEPNFENSPFTR